MIEWLVTNLKSILLHLANVLIDLINLLIDGVAGFCVFVIGLLPSGQWDPPSLVLPTDYPVIGWLNWLLPVSAFAAGLGLIIANEIAYFGISPILRWLKVVK